MGVYLSTPKTEKFSDYGGTFDTAGVGRCSALFEPSRQTKTAVVTQNGLPEEAETCHTKLQDIEPSSRTTTGASTDGGTTESACPSISRYGMTSMQGWRKTMEDSHIAEPYLISSSSFMNKIRLQEILFHHYDKNGMGLVEADEAAAEAGRESGHLPLPSRLGTSPMRAMSLYGVFDGHGGKSVSLWIQAYYNYVLLFYIHAANSCIKLLRTADSTPDTPSGASSETINSSAVRDIANEPTVKKPVTPPCSSSSTSSEEYIENRNYIYKMCHALYASLLKLDEFMLTERGMQQLRYIHSQYKKIHPEEEPRESGEAVGQPETATPDDDEETGGEEESGNKLLKTLQGLLGEAKDVDNGGAKSVSMMRIVQKNGRLFFEIARPDKDKSQKESKGSTGAKSRRGKKDKKSTFQRSVDLDEADDEQNSTGGEDDTRSSSSGSSSERSTSSDEDEDERVTAVGGPVVESSPRSQEVGSGDAFSSPIRDSATVEPTPSSVKDARNGASNAAGRAQRSGKDKIGSPELRVEDKPQDLLNETMKQEDSCKPTTAEAVASSTNEAVKQPSCEVMNSPSSSLLSSTSFVFNDPRLPAPPPHIGSLEAIEFPLLTSSAEILSDKVYLGGRLRRLRQREVTRPESSAASSGDEAEKRPPKGLSVVDLFLQASGHQPWSPQHVGATAVVTAVIELPHRHSDLITNSTLPSLAIITCNVGDSRAVMCRGIEGAAISMSVDHKPDHPVERSRVYAAGGFVASGRVDGNLNLSRSVGDLHYKLDSQRYVTQQKIISEGDIRYTYVYDYDWFVVIACDGIYDCMTNTQLVDFIKNKLLDFLKREDLDPDTTARLEGSGDRYVTLGTVPTWYIAKVCEQICDKCLGTSMLSVGCDNMTIEIVQFNTFINSITLQEIEALGGVTRNIVKCSTNGDSTKEQPINGTNGTTTVETVETSSHKTLNFSKTYGSASGTNNAVDAPGSTETSRAEEDSMTGDAEKSGEEKNPNSPVPIESELRYPPPHVRVFKSEYVERSVLAYTERIEVEADRRLMMTAKVVGEDENPSGMEGARANLEEDEAEDDEEDYIIDYTRTKSTDDFIFNTLGRVPGVGLTSGIRLGADDDDDDDFEAEDDEYECVRDQCGPPRIEEV